MAKQLKKTPAVGKRNIVTPAPPRALQGPVARIAAACVVYAIVVSSVFANVLFQSDQVLSMRGTDIWRQFVPWRLFGFSELARGHLALWNPYVFSGAPYLGGFQSALFYPLNWFSMILPIVADINFNIALHIFLAGVFMYCWAAYRRLHWAACLSAGFVYMFGGPEFGQIVAGHIPNIDTLIWAPLVFLAIDDVTMTASLRAALLGSVVVAMQIFAGHAQYVFYTGVAATIYFALNLYRAPDRRRALLGFCLCFAGGALLAAVQLFTGLGAAAEAVRSHTTYEFASTFSFPPENLLTMLAPGFFGDPTTMPYSYWGRWFWWEASAYIGVVGFVLAGCALLAPRRSRRFAFTMVAIIVVLATGKYTPLFLIIYRLPGFNSFRGTAKFMFLAVMFLSMLSAIGLDQLLSRGDKRVWPAAITSIGSAFLLFSAWLIDAGARDGTSLWGRSLNGVNWRDNHLMVANLFQSAKAASGELFWAGAIGLILAALLWVARLERRVLLGIPILLAGELMIFAGHYQPTFMYAQYRGQIDAVGNRLASLPPQSRIAASDQGQVFMANRLNSWGDDPMMLRRYVEFIAYALGVEPDKLATQTMRLEKDNRLYRLVRMAGVLVLDGGGVQLSTLTAQPLPRAELVSDTRVEPVRGKLLAAMNDPRFDPLQTAVIESPLTIVPVESGNPGRVVVQDINSDTLDVEAWANSSCLLVITDSYSTGWHAKALGDSDQQNYEVIPADLTLRGVPLGSGHHHFQLVYRPLAFVVGKWTSLAAIAVYLSIGIQWVRKGRR